MSALGDFVREIQQRIWLLACASDLDDDYRFCTTSDYLTRCHWRLPRRGWTRQDINRGRVNSWYSDHPDAELPPELESVCYRTRVRWFLRKYEDRCTLLEWQRRALAEAQQRGIYATIDPLLQEAVKRFGRYLWAYDQWQKGEYISGWDAIQKRMKAALEAIEPHIPPEDPPKLQQNFEKLTAAQKDIYRVLVEAGKRMTTTGVLSALSAKGLPQGESGIKQSLSAMIKLEVLTNKKDANPPGYGLPEWDQS